MNSIHHTTHLILNTFLNNVGKRLWDMYGVFDCLILCWQSSEKWPDIFSHRLVPQFGSKKTIFLFKLKNVLRFLETLRSSVHSNPAVIPCYVLHKYIKKMKWKKENDSEKIENQNVRYAAMVCCISLHRLNLNLQGITVWTFSQMRSFSLFKAEPPAPQAVTPRHLHTTGCHLSPSAHAPEGTDLSHLWS